MTSLMTRLFAQPDDLDNCQPNREEILVEGEASMAKIQGLQTQSWSAAAAVTWSELGPLSRLFRLWLANFLGEFNNLLLPPLFTLIVVEFGTGGLPRVLNSEVELANYAFCTLFLIEWVNGLALARSKTAYLTNLWLITDLISALPLAYVFQAMRLTRFGRVLRLMKLIKLVRARRFAFPFDRLARAGGISLSVALAGAFALEALEPDLVGTLPDALWWSIVTITTVGYGDISPATTEGRTVAVVLMVTGVGVFSYLAGIMSSVIFDPEEEEIIQAVTRIEDRLEQISTRLDDLS